MSREGIPQDRDEARIEQLVAAAHEAWAERLLVATSGNTSVRLDGGRFAISAARSSLGRLRREEVLVLELGEAAGGSAGTPDSSLRPSREAPLHRLVYQSCPRVGSVLHCQSFAATVFCCREGPLPELGFIPEVPVYLRRVGDVPYLPPGSANLARAVAGAFSDSEVRVVQLRNHGQVAIGATPGEAVERAAFFELACRLALVSETRTALRCYTPDELADLLEY